MTDPYRPFGPFYLTLVCENDETAGDIIKTVYIDGFTNESDAWQACNGLSLNPFKALDEYGDEIELAGDSVLQVTIAKTAAADFPNSFAAH